MSAIRRQFAATLVAAAVFFLLGALPCRAQSAPEKEIPAPYKVSGRPKVGLVLSGGGARGVAHIGVLKVLEELRVPVDFIVGTSMGSLVGGFYASGVSPEEMEKRIAGIDWPSVFNDDPARQDIPWRQKRDDFTDLFGLELGFRDGKLLVPLGTVAGYKFEFVMTEFVGLEAGRTERNFDTLPIPYRAVAMDLESGEAKVFDRGYLVKAMRASMSIPAAFAPVEIGGRLYVDGGMVRNLPVDVARRAGCGVIIAVNLGTPPLRRDQITSSASVALQAVNLMTEQNVKASLGELKDRDILIDLIPGLGDFSSSDFTGATKTIPIGIKAARAVEEKLRALSVSEKDYLDWQKVRASRMPGAVEITDVQVVAQNLKWVNPEVIETEIKQKPTRIEAGIEERILRERERSELDTLQRDLTTVFGRGDFERLDYTLEEDRDKKVIKVQAIEKSWGPNYFGFGLGYASDFSDQQRLTAEFMHRMTWLNSLGAEWRNDATIGFVNWIHSEFYQPFTRRVGVFAAPWFDAKQAPINYYLGDTWIGEYKVNTVRGGLDLGWQGRLGEIRLGFFQGNLKTDSKFGVLSVNSSLVPEYDLRQGGWTGKLVIDQLDSASFPRKGVLLGGSFFVTDPSFGADDDYNKVELFFQKPFNIDRHTLTLGLFGGESPDSKLPAYDLFQLGGFQRFSGYILDQLVGDSYFLGRLVYTYRFADLPQPLGRGVYLGGSFEVGEVGNRFDPTTAGGTLYCGSVFFGADTILGPLYFAYGRSADGSNAFYFMLGMQQR